MFKELIGKIVTIRTLDNSIYRKTTITDVCKSGDGYLIRIENMGSTLEQHGDFSKYLHSNDIRVINPY